MENEICFDFHCYSLSMASLDIPLYSRLTIPKVVVISSHIVSTHFRETLSFFQLMKQVEVSISVVKAGYGWKMPATEGLASIYK